MYSGTGNELTQRKSVLYVISSIARLPRGNDQNCIRGLLPAGWPYSIRGGLLYNRGIHGAGLVICGLRGLLFSRANAARLGVPTDVDRFQAPLGALPARSDRLATDLDKD